MARDADGEPIADPEFWTRTVYHVQIFLDGQFLDTLGANSEAGLSYLLRSLALRVEPGRLVQVAIWDSIRETWIRADGLELSEDTALFNLETTCHVGSVNV